MISGRLACLLFGVAAVLSSALDAAQSVTAAGSAPAIQVAFLLPNGADPRWHQDALTFVNRLEANAPGATWIFVNAHNRTAVQLRQAKEAVDGGAKVLVVAPVSSDSAAQIV